MLNETASVAAWSADVYLRRVMPPAETVLGPLALGCIALLAGPRGVGKSWLALALAHAAARGGTLGAWRARRRHRVVYLDAGGGEAVLHARLRALGPPPPTLVIASADAPGGLPDLTTESARTALDQLTTDADLVVIDGLSALVRTGRGVGARWAALGAWLRDLRRRGLAVLLVDTAEPRALPLLADTVLRAERPADGVADADLRLQLRLLSSRTKQAMQRCELRLSLRKDGAAWRYIDDIDHRAILAYRLDRQDYSSREIAKILRVSPATAWRLIGRGERMPAHLRDGVDLEVPEAKTRKKKSEWAAFALSLLPRQDEEPTRDSTWEDEGRCLEADDALSAQNRLSSSGLTRGSSSDLQARDRASCEGGLGPRINSGDDNPGNGGEAAASEGLSLQTLQPREAMKQPV